MTVIICPNCGEKIDSSVKRTCRYCGAMLEKEKVLSQSQISRLQKHPATNNSKISFILGLISLIITISSVAFSLFIIISVRVSFHYTFGSFSDSSSIPISIAYGNLQILGVGMIIVSAIGLVLGIFPLILRKTRVSNNPRNRLAKFGVIFGIVGMALSSIGILEGILMCTTIAFPHIVI